MLGNGPRVTERTRTPFACPACKQLLVVHPCQPCQLLLLPASHIITHICKMEVERPKAMWKAPWWKCCGNCSGLDWISCCTAYFVPCVAYGCTSAKLLKRRWWVEALKYMALFYIPAIVKVLLQLAVHTTCKAAPGSPMPDDASAACFFFFTLYVAVLPLGLICLVAWAVLVGGARRTQIRRMLGIAESRAGGDCCSWMVAPPGKGRWSDCCLHFWCLCCALAQEMRTVMHVEEGFSLPAYQEGPADGYCQVAMEPPEVEDMDRPLLMVVDSAGSMKDVSLGVGKV